MNLDQYRAWLQAQIDRLNQAPSEEWSDCDHQEARELLGQAYELALSLRLPQAEIAAQPGAVRIRLCELLQSLPAPGYLTRDQLAELLGVSSRTISRRIYQGSLPEPMKVGRLSRFSVNELKSYGINL